MNKYYIFFRCWEHFAADFPFEKFDDRPDDEINDDLEKYAADYPQDHKKRFRTRTHKKVGRLATALQKRAKQRTHRPSGHSGLPHQTEQIQLEPEGECSPGCQNAYRMGWISAPLLRFGGLSPSPQWFVAVAEGKQCARESVDALNKVLPSTDGWVEYGHLRIRFGYLPASQFDIAKRVEIELGMEDLTQIEPSTFDECVQKQIAEVAPRVVAEVFYILNPEAERPKTPPTVRNVNTTVRAAQVSKQTSILQIGAMNINMPPPSDAAGTEDSAGEDGSPLAASKTGQGGTSPSVAESKQLPWSDDEEFLPSKEAVAMSEGKMSPSVLSRLLTPTGPIRYMRKRPRCKVHVGDFRRHLRTLASGLSKNEASDIADEYLNDIEERRAAEHKKKDKEAGK